jgi:hypothetical protein
MNAEVSGSEAVDGLCFQHQFKGQSSEGAGISLVTDYASNFDAVALAEHHKSEAVRLDVIKEGHEEEERRPPPAQLQLLFQKQPDDIKLEKLHWSKYTQEQAQRAGGASVESHGEHMRNGGLASVESHGEQMRNGGFCSVETNGEQMRNGGRASVELRSKHHIFSPPVAWAKIAVASGLGAAHTNEYKLKYDPYKREMDVAMSGFFKVGTQLPIRKKRRAVLAASMGLSIRSKKFRTA